MPRLRVLSMRNNQLRSIKERTFRNVRGNIAILDVDGKYFREQENRYCIYLFQRRESD